MPKVDHAAVLQQMYSRMTLDQLKETRDNVLAQLEIINRLISDQEEVSGDEK